MSLTTHDDDPTTFFRRGPQPIAVRPRPEPAWKTPAMLVGAGMLVIGSSNLAVFEAGGRIFDTPGGWALLSGASVGLAVGGYLMSTFGTRVLQAFPPSPESRPLWALVGRRPELLALALTVLLLVNWHIPGIQNVLAMPERLRGQDADAATIESFVQALPDPGALVVLLGAGLIGAIVGFIRLEVLQLRQ